jgi:hypothetical protein
MRASIITRNPSTLPICLAAAWLAGCEPPDRGPGQTPSREVGAFPRAVVSGASAVKTDGVGQAETAETINTATGNLIRVITYNDRDYPPFLEYTETDRIVRSDASMMGWSVKQGSLGWAHVNFYPGATADWPVYWGDPAIATVPATATVFMLNLAVHKSRWSGENHGAMFVNGACIVRSTDGGVSFSLFQCVHRDLHFYDGSALAGASGDRMYAAFFDTDNSARKIDVWLSTGGGQFALLPDPFPGKIISSHPRLRALGEKVYVAAVDSNSQLLYALYSPSSNSWSAAKVVATVAGNTEVTLKSGIPIRQNGAFAFAYGNVSEFVTQVRFWYQVSSGGALILQGSHCPTDPASGTACTQPSNWRTPSGINSFMPAMATAKVVPKFGGSVSYIWKLTWQTEENQPMGNVTLAQGNFDLSQTNGRFWRSLTQGSQTPCPDLRGYWGDYDEMQAYNSGTSNPTFSRPYTDSTDGTCVRWQFKGTPQHVSEALFPAGT